METKDISPIKTIVIGLIGTIVKLDEIGTYKLDNWVINPLTSINYRCITYKLWQIFCNHPFFSKGAPFLASSSQDRAHRGHLPLLQEGQQIQLTLQCLDGSVLKT